MSGPAGWGPSHQGRRRWSRRPWWWQAIGYAGLAAWFFLWQTAIGFVVLVLVPLLIAVLGLAAVRGAGWSRTTISGKLLLRAEDPLRALMELARRAGGGVYLGLDKDGVLRFARSQRAVLVLGPPRSGKTSAVIIPSLIAHDGPAIVTSTKPDVASATSAARKRLGRCWVFDPTGREDQTGLAQLRWSPVRCATDWDGAVLMARAMTAAAGVGAGTTHGSHWAKRSQALLGPFLHAAALDGRNMETVVDWVLRHELDEAGILLEQDAASRLAFGSLLGILNTEDRERASIFSAAADALDAYSSEAALEAAADPNFDPAAFVTSGDTVYIHAPAEEQTAAAPLVCGLLAEIRRATYAAHRQGTLKCRVLFALDEAANIAPLDELPQIASEGGGQGLTLLAAFQDLSQARKRWGEAADGFLTLFGTKLILPGVADSKTLEAISLALGEYDRKMVATGTTPLAHSWLPGRTRTVSTQRTRVLSPGEIANIPGGDALHLDGLVWERVTLTPAYAAEPWKTILTSPSR
jgi:type IV secretory pathway TraG/TraD family ATPase VirD4